ncbi:hypothetical protein H2199_004641 [Coniosporium tulheliwenetii]|uniref:Uncharacterized protein n=1 Tax=Coniosporium tulheliwenetii TaxID=3383036 RepID=A0ACC2Z715_9PEZI|nr:hypothetical protein H2199_004641 [Cladosporium sp. JES 115]
MSLASLLAAIFLFQYTIAQDQPRCYYPDGSLDTDGYVCNTTAVRIGGHSSCCRHDDACYASGTCLQDWSGVTYRQSCTDSSWRSEDCPSQCLIPEAMAGAIWIQSCSMKNKTACCVTGDTGSCCEGSTFEWAPGYIIAVINGDGTNRLTPYVDVNARTVGLAVGIPVGIIALAILTAFIISTRRLKQQRAHTKNLEEKLTYAEMQRHGNGPSGQHFMQNPPPGYAQPRNTPYEMPGEVAASEVGGEGAGGEWLARVRRSRKMWKKRRGDWKRVMGVGEAESKMVECVTVYCHLSVRKRIESIIPREVGTSVNVWKV